MHIKPTLVIALGALVLLAGCSRTMSSKDYAIMREEVRYPEMRKAHMRACVKAFSRGGPEKRARLARLARASVASAPIVACQRMIRAVAQGRMTQEEFNGTGEPGKIAKIIRG